MWSCDLWAFFEIICHRKSPSSSVVILPSCEMLWPLNSHAHTFLDHDSFHQSCRSGVVGLSTIMMSLVMNWKCEHWVWIDTFLLESGTTIAIFIWIWNKIVSNKVGERIWLCHLFGVVGLTFGSVKTDLWSGRIPFKEDSPWQEFPACSNESSNKIMSATSY